MPAPFYLLPNLKSKAHQRGQMQTLLNSIQPASQTRFSISTTTLFPSSLPLLLSIDTRVLTQEVKGRQKGKKSGWGRQRVSLQWLQMGTWYAVLSTINKNIVSEKVYKQVYWKENYKQVHDVLAHRLLWTMNFKFQVVVITIRATCSPFLMLMLFERNSVYLLFQQNNLASCFAQNMVSYFRGKI